jgi:hypothetical protein
VSDAWNESRVTLLHKGGHNSKKKLKNYRPIALADTCSKIFCVVLNEQMQMCVEHERVLVKSRMVSGVIEEQKTTYLL